MGLRGVDVAANGNVSDPALKERGGCWPSDDEARERGEDAHVVGIRSVDARDERLGDLVQAFLTKPAGNEGTEALVAALFSARLISP